MMEATITAAFTCVDQEMARETFADIDFAELGMASEILSVEVGELDDARDETLLPEYRTLQQCGELRADYVRSAIPSHMRTYLGRIRLVSMDVDRAVMRTRILSVPIGNHDCGFTIDSIFRKERT